MGVFELGLAGAADGQAVLGRVAVVVEAQVELVAHRQAHGEPEARLLAQARHAEGGVLGGGLVAAEGGGEAEVAVEALLALDQDGRVAGVAVAAADGQAGGAVVVHPVEAGDGQGLQAGQGAEVVAVDDLAGHPAELDGEAQPRREGEVEAGAGEGLVDAAELALREVEVGPVGLVEHDLGELQVAGLVVALEVHGLEGGGGGDGRGAGQPGQVDPVVAGQAFVPLFEQAAGLAGVGVAQRGGGLGPQRARQALAVLVPQEAAHAFHLALVDEPRQHQLAGCRAEGGVGGAVEAQQLAQQGVGRVAGVLAAGEAQAGQAAHLVELLGCRLGLRGAAFLPQQGLAQAPGAVGVAVLFEGVGVGQHPQKVVPVLAQARRVVTVEGPLGPG